MNDKSEKKTKLRLKFEKSKQKELLQYYQNFKECKNRKELAEILSVKLGTLKGWLSEYYTLPVDIFNEICIRSKEATKFKKFIIGRLSENWGGIKGGLNRISKINDFKKYAAELRAKKEEKRIKTHFILRKNVKIRNKEALNLIKNKVDLKCVLSTYLLTDGHFSGKEGHRVAFYTKDCILKEFIYEILFQESKFLPAIQKTKKGIYMVRVSDRELTSKLIQLVRTSKRLPYNGQKIEDYLSEVQPTLTFLKKTDEKTRENCIRLALTTDGSISLSKNRTYNLALSCYHPSLCQQWRDIFQMCNMESSIINCKNSWCGVSGIRLSKESIIRFWKIGGFIDGVEISKKSKKYEGLEKNQLLGTVVDIINSKIG